MTEEKKDWINEGMGQMILGWLPENETLLYSLIQQKEKEKDINSKGDPERNLLHETVYIMMEKWKLPKDILYIGSPKSDYRCTWEEFVELADIDYTTGGDWYEERGDDEYPIVIPHDLTIYFKDGAQLRRTTFAGADEEGVEGWAYIHGAKPDVQGKPIQRLVSIHHYRSLQEVQEGIGGDEEWCMERCHEGYEKDKNKCPCCLEINPA